MRDYIDDHHLKVQSEPASSESRLRRPLIQGAMLCLLASLLFWLDLQGTLAPVRGLVEQGLTPVALQMSSVSNLLGDSWSTLSEWQQLRADYAELQEEHSQLQARLIEQEHALVENARLRQQLDIEERQPWQLLGAEVTLRSPDAVRRVITIARGSHDQVTRGMAVIGQTGSGPVALVGIVEEVAPRTATVLLTTDFACRVSARVLNDGDTALGLVQGQWQRGSRLRLEQVDHINTMEEGATVVSAGLSGSLDTPLPMASIPPGVPIGQIETIENDGANQYAELRPFADPDEVRYVWVILGQSD
jgi:rod shape-determining protein MreC